MQAQRIDVADATIALAAQAVTRTGELLETGWGQHLLNDGVEKFCIQGALMLAINEMIGDDGQCSRVYVCQGNDAQKRGYGDIEAIATAFIVQAAADHYKYDRDAWKAGRLGGAEFNDAADRTQEQVLHVISVAAKRLWDVYNGTEATKTGTISWADDVDETFKQSVMVSVLE